MSIDLLLTRHGDRQPVLEQPLQPLAGAQGLVALEGPADGYMRDDMKDPQNLSTQGWGIVVPEAEGGEALLKAVEELLGARREQQGRDVKVYRVEAGMSAARAAQWKREVYWDSNVAREERPRYLFILGDLDGVSLEFQQIVGADAFVGRAAFPTIEGYSSYVQKVLAWERKPSAESMARPMFYTVMDGTRATALGRRGLVSPLIDACELSKKNGHFRASDIVEIPYEYGLQDPAARLLSAVSDSRPGVLFSVSHGLGPPRGGFDSPEERRALQGAMCLGEDKRLTGADLLGQTFLPGGIWFMLSCYGGATPAASVYHRWLKVLRAHNAYREPADAVLEGLPRAGERPFVAALPQSVLANPKGPLAVIAHADLAWSCSFEDMGSKQNHIERFAGLVSGIVGTNRVGTAFYDLYRFFSETNTELTTRYDVDIESKERDWVVERSRLWMLRNDLVGYLLLGDPAVRLPLAGTGSVLPGKTVKVSSIERARRMIPMG